MARRLGIEALYLDVRFPVQERFCTHRFGLLSEPEFMSKASGDAVNLRNISRIDVRKEASASIISSLLANLIDGIASKAAVPEKTLRNTLADQVGGYVDDTRMQLDNDLHGPKMEIGNKISQQLSNSGSDHLVPENELKWEDDQESVDDLWNDMSSSQNNGLKFQNSRKSTNSTATIAYNSEGSKHSQNESDEFDFSLTHPSSPGEFDGASDMFSQKFQKNLLSKKQKVIRFGKTKPLPSTQIRSGPSYVSAARSCKQRVVSYSQNDQRNAFQRISEIEFGMSPMVKQDEDEKEVDLEGFIMSPTVESQFALQNSEPDLFDDITVLADSEGMTEKLNVNTEETDTGDFSSQSHQVASLKDDQDAFVCSTESRTEMSDIYDEEIDAAIENYVSIPKEVFELCCGSSHKIPDHLQDVDSVKLSKKNVDVCTQTMISGSIHSSSTCNRIEESSTLKRSLQALCLENSVFKKRKTTFLSSSVHSMNEQPTEIEDIGESPKHGDHEDVTPQFGELKMPSESRPTNDFGNDETFWPREKKDRNDSNNDKLEQNNIKEETEPSDQEVPRNLVTIGTLPIPSPANFCWDNDPQASIGYDDDTVDSDALTKSKPPRRMRLGLSRRAKPAVSLHRFL